jgi:protein SCO1
MIRQLSNSKFLIPAMMVLAILAAGTGFYISLKQSQQSMQANPGIEGLFWPNPKQINAFSTIDQNGRPFGLEQLSNTWSFLFFGYIHCPDVCPVTMAVMAEAYKELITENMDIQNVFVSVDPERDTTEKLSQYVTYFNADFIGLGGNNEMVNSLTRQIGVAYFLNNEEQTENYLVDHSASIFLIDPKGRMVGKLSQPHQKTKIVEQFTKIKNFIDEQS